MSAEQDDWLRAWMAKQDDWLRTCNEAQTREIRKLNREKWGLVAEVDRLTAERDAARAAALDEAAAVAEAAIAEYQRPEPTVDGSDGVVWWRAPRPLDSIPARIRALKGGGLTIQSGRAE